MISLGELRLEATVENLRTISHFVRAVGERLRLTEKVVFDIELAIDEAATNIVIHAYPDGPGIMMVGMETIENIIRITLSDWGIPLKPGDIRPFDIEAPIETRIKGGMGLHFINTLMDSVTRITADKPGEPNMLILTKRIERKQVGAPRVSATQELNAVLSISQVMATSFDLDWLLERIVSELVKVIDAERGTLYLVDEDREELFSYVLMEEEDQLQEIRIKIGEGIAGEVAASGVILNIKDAQKHPSFNRSFDDMTGYKTRTMLVAPMRDRYERIIGVVQLLNKRGRRFTSHDERLLTAMAAQAAISIENVRLYNQEMEQEVTNRELETARRIQKSFLPQSVPQHSDWDIAAYWRPMRDVAGDFYDFFDIPDGRLAVVVADVSGKGVPASLFMALSVTVLRFAMGMGLTPAEMMDQANRAILQGQQSKMFTTAFVGYLDIVSGVMQFASAGHNPPLHFHTNTGEVAYLSAPGVAMGVFKDARFVEERVNIAKGDVLVLYTDGITEVINSEEEEFGEERLEEIVGDHASASAQYLVDHIIESVAEFAEDLGAFDDETLIVLKRLP